MRQEGRAVGFAQLEHRGGQALAALGALDDRRGVLAAVGAPAGRAGFACVAPGPGAAAAPHQVAGDAPQVGPQAARSVEGLGTRPVGGPGVLDHVFGRPGVAQEAQRQALQPAAVGLEALEVELAFTHATGSLPAAAPPSRESGRNLYGATRSRVDEPKPKPGGASGPPGERAHGRSAAEA